MQFYLLVGLGGALGAMCRYLVYQFVERSFTTSFPWATLFVNCLGGLLAGFILGFMNYKFAGGAMARLFLISGFLGAFTTFSSFSIETVHLLFEGSYWKAMINIGLNNVGAIVLAMGGLWLARHCC